MLFFFFLQQRSSSFDATPKKKQASEKTSEINISILKFFIAKGIDLDSIDSPLTTSMTNLLNPNHNPPDSKTFSTVILEQAVSNNFSLNLNKSKTGVIELLTVVTDESLFMLATLLCHDDVEIFLQLSDYGRDASFDCNNATVITWLMECCTDSIRTAAESYNVSVQFVIHDGKFELPDFYRYDDDHPISSYCPRCVMLSLRSLISIYQHQGKQKP